ncbi:MAG: D-alanyl-D-alanine carboxypeptidase [Defluviitaleaceae bacterium]|nr:D-alanyl-D-alanine carboxypeptidase [Defluviitaleaceae bacterium]
MQKKLIVLFAAVFLIIATTLYLTLIRQNEQPIILFSRSAVVMSVRTGEILFEKDMNLPMPPASTAKLMGILLVLEEIHQSRLTLDEIVIISEEAANIRASRAGFVVGDAVSVDNLIMGVMLPSGSEAVMALGEHIFGNEAAFVHAMNERAAELGMIDTYFTNSVGLHNPENLSTAYDLAILARYLLQNHPEIINYSSRPGYTFEASETEKTEQNIMHMRNTNDLLMRIPGITGLKTGSGQWVGFNLVGSYSDGRNGRRDFIFVLIGAAESALRRIDSELLIERFR